MAWFFAVMMLKLQMSNITVLCIKQRPDRIIGLFAYYAFTEELSHKS